MRLTNVASAKNRKEGAPERSCTEGYRMHVYTSDATMAGGMSMMILAVTYEETR